MRAGGPKLRKWYGEGELPADGGSAVVEKMPEPEDIPPEDVKRDAILVTDADSPTGEQVVLQLILARYLPCLGTLCTSACIALQADVAVLPDC